MTKTKVNQLFRILAQHIPKPVSELRYDNHYQLLVAVILSAQCTDVAVNKATEPLFKAAPTPEKILSLGETKLKKYIRSLGLFNNKAKSIIQTSKLLIEKHQSAVPNDRRALEKLPGVGRKTAGVVLNVAFGESEIPVDTHVFRVANRIGLVSTRTAFKTEDHLKKIIPTWVGKDAHHLLILHGRYTCKARTPNCDNCPICQLCQYSDKNLSAKN